MNTHSKFLALAFAASLGCSSALAASEEPPAGATGKCSDGTYTNVHFERGACEKHGGVKEWYGAPKTQAKRDNTGEGDGKAAVGISTERGDRDTPPTGNRGTAAPIQK